MSNQKIPKVRELAFKKLNKNIEEVEKPKKTELPREICFGPFGEHRRTPKSTRINWKKNIPEVEKLETIKIHMQNLSTPASATGKMREFTYKTKMQARKHVNSDDFCPVPFCHLDLPPRPLGTWWIKLFMWDWDYHYWHFLCQIC